LLFSDAHSREESATAEPGYTAKSGRLAFVNLAEAYRHEGMLDDAVRILREGLGREPELLAGRLALGRLLLERGEAEAALREAARIEALAPGAPEALELRAEIMLRRRAGTAPAEDASPVEGSPPPLASPTLAALYLSQGYVDRARAIALSGAGAETTPGVETLRRLEALRRAARRRRMEGAR
jgi:tetratricopeptide (TPR) repeat protein